MTSAKCPTAQSMETLPEVRARPFCCAPKPRPGRGFARCRLKRSLSVSKTPPTLRHGEGVIATPASRTTLAKYSPSQSVASLPEVRARPCCCALHRPQSATCPGPDPGPRLQPARCLHSANRKQSLRNADPTRRPGSRPGRTATIHPNTPAPRPVRGGTDLRPASHPQTTASRR